MGINTEILCPYLPIENMPVPLYIHNFCTQGVSKGFTKAFGFRIYGKRLSLLKASEVVQLLAQDGKVKDVDTLNKIEKLPIEEKYEVVKRICSGQPAKEAINTQKQDAVSFSVTKEQVEKILTSFGSETPKNSHELKIAWDAFLKKFED